MSERTDHAAEARVWLDVAQRSDTPVGVAAGLASIAQAHATLALVEQQRAANLIAWGHGYSLSPEYREEILAALRAPGPEPSPF